MKYFFSVAFLISSICFSYGQIEKVDSVNFQADSLHLMIGQMIITGVGDRHFIEDSNSILADIESGKVGGVIFFGKNISKEKSALNIKSVIDTLQAYSSIPLLISIDQEGGKVNRLKESYGFPKSVQAEYLGELNELDSTKFYADKTAEILSDLGFNLNFAPDVDVNIYAQNPVIGRMGRSYSADESIVAQHASEVVKAHRKQNVLTVLKHFPGHGSSRSDTHLGLTDVTSYWQFRELLPYKTLLDSGLVDAIMTAHIINAHLDEDKIPSTLSSRVIGDMLRNVMGYEGVVFSDDMQMHAISKEYGFKEAIKMSIYAGVDILMFANNVERSDKKTPTEIHQVIYSMVQSGEISEDRIKASFNRIMNLKKNL